MSEDSDEQCGARHSSASTIAAVRPRGTGHQFVLYGDACSGISGAPHEHTFARVNSVIRRLIPPPEFIVFTGDEIVGLTADEEDLKAQWHHWLLHEMGWLDRQTTPMWHATSNHTTYDEMSEATFVEVLDMPRNGPQGQEGLSYWVRRGDLLVVFVHTLWSGLGGEGHVETDWLRETLARHADARHKLVVGHHPVHPINGFSGRYQREIGPEHASEFWAILVSAGVLAYVCGHILAFDVQVQQGVLQICTAGAGTAHRMPDDVEYLHCVQAALDSEGLRYQVLDEIGRVRERLQWPVPHLPAEQWRSIPAGTGPALFTGRFDQSRIVRLRFTGRTEAAAAPAQTFLSAFSPGQLPSLWIGVRGPQQNLTVIIARKPGRSPHYWLGPSVGPDCHFTFELMFHADMGPGGVLYRAGDSDGWSSLQAASSTGPEQLDWPKYWSIGHDQGGSTDRSFLGTDLRVAAAIG